MACTIDYTPIDEIIFYCSDLWIWCKPAACLNLCLKPAMNDCLGIEGGIRTRDKICLPHR